MKVIKDNFNCIKQEVKSIICPECTSELEYTKDDLTLYFWRTEGWTNSKIKYLGFFCPCCKYQIGIETLIS